MGMRRKRPAVGGGSAARRPLAVQGRRCPPVVGSSVDTDTAGPGSTHLIEQEISHTFPSQSATGWTRHRSHEGLGSMARCWVAPPSRYGCHPGPRTGVCAIKGPCRTRHGGNGGHVTVPAPARTSANGGWGVPVIREIGRVAWYRLRLDLPRRWTSYAGIVLLVALVGGLALGSIAGARRSESAFPTFLKGTNPSDLAIDVGLYNPKILKEIARLPQVKSIETYVSPNAVPVTQRASSTPTARCSPRISTPSPA